MTEPTTTPAVVPQATPSATPVTPGVPTTHPQRLASLYVGDLAPDVTESDLFELFKAVKTVQSIKVCRDNVTRESLGYAYVNFTSAESADKGISLFNYTILKGKPIRINWSQRDPSRRRSNVGNLFIKNFPKDLDSLALEELFQVHGNILSCKVQTDREGHSCGYGFVHFEKEEAAQEAIKAMNNAKVGDKALFVGPFIPKAKRNPGPSQFTNVFVKNIPSKTTLEEFTKLFADFGEITSPWLRIDSDRETTHGFVNFASHDSAVKAISEMNEKEIDGFKLYAGRAQSRAERDAELKAKREKLYEETKRRNLFVKHLPTNVTEQQFTNLFSQFGTITSSKLAMDNGVPKGFGFVCFSTPEEATAARESNLKMDGKPLFIAIAQRKVDRRALLEAQHGARGVRPMPTMGYPSRMFSAHPSWNMPPGGVVPQYSLPWTPSPGFSQSVVPKTFANVTPVDVQEQLRIAVSKTHPEKASEIAKLIFDSTAETNDAMTVLKNPTLLEQRIKESITLLERTTGN